MSRQPRRYHPSSAGTAVLSRQSLSNNTIYVHPLLVDVVKHAIWWSRACIDLGTNLMTIPIFTEDVSLQRISIFLLNAYYIIPYLECILPVEAEGSPPPLIPPLWLWCAPLLMSFSIGIIASSPYWWRPHREETLLMITALVALFFLETLPIVMLLSSATLVMRQLDWMTGVAIICLVWAVLIFLTHFVRCAVYQTIGERS